MNYRLLEALPLEGGNRVAVLAENLEHALGLAKYLPGEPIITGDRRWTVDLSTSKKDRLKPRKPHEPEITITTIAGLSRVGPVEVLLRADSGRGLPPLPEEALLGRSDETKPMCIIDCHDRHHPMLRNLSQARKCAYLDAGWQVAGEPEQAPLDRFLATCPEVLL